MTDSYRTILSLSKGLYKDKGSKFLAFALPVSSLDEVREQLTYYNNQYHDARHVCYAYMLGVDKEEYRVNDDGEPSGTAGRSILGQIQSFELTNVLIVVVRYFGGILLGTSGLIVAYKEAAKEALNAAQIIDREVMQERTIRCSVEVLGQWMRKIRQANAQVLSQDFFDNEYVLRILVPQRYISLFER